uniref:Helicase ATP-binding domain-containing protein n=1 Tax=viral metagenome TaxID=1070528 RepID=A0A6C0D3H1_9ZZZZ
MQKLFDDLYPNQLDFGKRIVQALEYHHTVIAFAHTQCGKTGSVLAAIHLSNIPLNRIFIITGLSSIDWLVQTKKRIPIKNIFHRNTLHLFMKAVAKVQNPLVIIDESHIASKPGQIIHKITSSIDAQYVLVSATHDWKRFDPLPEGVAIRVMTDPPKYISVNHFAENDQLFQCKNLANHPDALDHIREIIPFLQKPAYHIIRTARNELHQMTITNFKSVFGSNYKFLSMPDLKILSSKPSCHTFIFIKDTLRCAVTIPKPYIGVLYERFTNYPNRSSIIQGLLGRATGFESKHIIVFSYPDMI